MGIAEGSSWCEELKKMLSELRGSLGDLRLGLEKGGFSHRRVLMWGGRLGVCSVSGLGRVSGLWGTCHTCLPERVHITERWLQLS